MTNQSMDSYDQAPAATLVEDRLVRRLAEVYPLHTRSIPVTHSGAEALQLDITKYRESTPGARDYKVIASKVTKGTQE